MERMGAEAGGGAAGEKEWKGDVRGGGIDGYDAERPGGTFSLLFEDGPGPGEEARGVDPAVAAADETNGRGEAKRLVEAAGAREKGEERVGGGVAVVAGAGALAGEAAGDSSVRGIVTYVKLSSVVSSTLSSRAAASDWCWAVVRVPVNPMRRLPKLLALVLLASLLAEADSSSNLLLRLSSPSTDDPEVDERRALRSSSISRWKLASALLRASSVLSASMTSPCRPPAPSPSRSLALSEKALARLFGLSPGAEALFVSSWASPARCPPAYPPSECIFCGCACAALRWGLSEVSVDVLKEAPDGGRVGVSSTSECECWRGCGRGVVDVIPWRARCCPARRVKR